jgi:ABC-type glycerol-3-phosphate transport system permease component
VFYILVCASAGFAFGKLHFKGKNVIYLGVIFVMSFPQMVLSLQIVKVCNILHLANTYAGIIFVWVAYFAPFGTFMMATYFSSVPMSLVEAARIDGANIFTILSKIMIPVAAPMITTITIIGFQSMWNELAFSLALLQDVSKRTMTLGLAMIQGEFGLPDTIVAASICLTSIAPVLLFLAIQKHINLGATAGAVKG